MRFDHLPDARAAEALLADILSRPVAPGPRRIDRPFALYGAGKLGRMAMDFLGHIGAEPDLVVDANADAQRDSPYWRDRPLVTPAQVSADSKTSLPLIVCIATVCFEDLEQELRRQGWLDIVPIYDVIEAYHDRYPLRNGWFMGDMDPAGQSATRQVLAKWDDDISRAHHLQFLAWHRLREDWVFDGAPVDLDRRYFIPEVASVLGAEEVFLDVGAHRGEIAEAFRRTVNDQFTQVLMFEPDPGNASVVLEALARLPKPLRLKHQLMLVALSNHGGKQRFFPGLGYASQITDLGNFTVDAKPLDEMDLSPTYLKLHLEGHELDALQGGELTLRRCRPIIAVTTYHSDAGIWKLPIWLMETLTDYRHYLRLHSWCGTGAVMYCVPAERRQLVGNTSTAQ